MLTCSVCHATYPDDVSFCTRDGSPLNIIGEIEVDSLDDDFATAISDSTPELELVLDLAEDLNAVEVTVEGDDPEETPYQDTSTPSPVSSHQDAPSEEAREFSLNVGRDLPAGTMVGEYRIEQKIAEGGMGIVYAAVQPLIGKRVAVKILHPRFAREATVVERFMQEARSVNTIGHPNIVDIFAFNKLSDGRHYLVMELLEGEDLGRLLKKKKRLTLSEAVPILLQVGQALSAAHEKGVIHRDLKPDNIFLLKGPPPPRVKLLDFGVAKLLDNEKQQNMTSAGGLVGTPNYMSPEQCSGGVVDGLSDLYSLAVLTYECLVGQVPFPGSYLEVITAHLQREPPPFPDDLDLGGAETKAQLEALVLRALSKERDKRPQSVSAFIEELERIAFTSGQYIPPMLSTGSHAAIVISQSMQMAAVTGFTRESPLVTPAPEVHRKPTTLSSAIGEIQARESWPTKPKRATTAHIQQRPNPLRRLLPLAGGVAFSAALAVIAATFLKKPSQDNAPVQAQLPPPVEVKPIQIQTTPPGGDIFDTQDFLLGQAPFAVNPAQEKQIIVRWRGRFSTPVDLTEQSGTLTISPRRPEDPAAEPLLAQLDDPALGLSREVMSKLHTTHEKNLRRCEDCHSLDLALDASLCQGCHIKGGEGASIDATQKAQCGSCHTAEFKPPRNKKFHKPNL